MEEVDDFSSYDDELLDGRYDCIDRIVLNGYFPLGQQGGGFRTWWRALTGSDETLDQAHLQRLAGRFSRRLHAWAKQHAVPLLHCPPGERKHELAEHYLPEDPDRVGLFLILVAKAPGLVWEVKPGKNGVPHLQRKTPWPHVNHYHFHIIDPEWGHITIKMSGHPPFGLCFALDVEEQRQSNFRYRYSAFQLEYSRNLLFTRGTTLDAVFQGLIDRTRRHLDVPKLRTLFGYKNRPQHRQGNKPLRIERVLDQSAYDLTVFKVHFGPLTLKLYDKGARVLRAEAIAHNIKGLRCGKSIEKLPIMLVELQRMVIDFLNVIQAAHCSFLPQGILDELAEPTQRGPQRLAGVDLQKPRIRAVAEALLALAPKSGGFTLAELAERVRPALASTAPNYAPRQAGYDLSKLRGKALVERVVHTRRYRVRPAGIRILAGLLILRERVIEPVLAGLGKPRVGRPPKHVQPLDQHDDALQQELRRTFLTLGLAA